MLVIHTMGMKGDAMDIGIGSGIGKGMVVIYNTDGEVVVVGCQLCR